MFIKRASFLKTMNIENPLSEKSLKYLDIVTEHSKQKFVYVRCSQHEQENAIAQQLFEYLAPQKKAAIDRLSLDHTHLPPAVARKYGEYFKKRFHAPGCLGALRLCESPFGVCGEFKPRIRIAQNFPKNADNLASDDLIFCHYCSISWRDFAFATSEPVRM